MPKISKAKAIIIASSSGDAGRSSSSAKRSVMGRVIARSLNHDKSTGNYSTDIQLSREEKRAFKK